MPRSDTHIIPVSSPCSSSGNACFSHTTIQWGALSPQHWVCGPRVHLSPSCLFLPFSHLCKTYEAIMPSSVTRLALMGKGFPNRVPTGVSSRVVWQADGGGFASQTTSSQQGCPETEAYWCHLDHSVVLIRVLWALHCSLGTRAELGTLCVLQASNLYVGCPRCSFCPHQKHLVKCMEPQLNIFY